jgi:glutaredoxin 3
LGLATGLETCDFEKLHYLHARIINMSIVMYVKPDCPYCQRAREYYNENNIPFIEYDAQNDKARQREMLDYTSGDLTVPAIVENGEYIQSGWGDPPRG